MKGRGAYVKNKLRLNDNEYSCLKTMMDEPMFYWTGKMLTQQLNWSDRKVANAVSNLHGMDLIKSSKYELTLTESEIGEDWQGKPPSYWIGHGKGEPIWQRAQYVLDNKGSLRNILSGEMDFSLQLFPLRLLRKVTLLAQISSITGDDIILSLQGLTLSEQQKNDFGVLVDAKKVKVTFESS